MRIFLAALAICFAGYAISASPTASVADGVITGDEMPRKLSDYGFFRDASGWEPNAGVKPYQLTSSLFTDYAEKYRFIYVPPGKTMISDGPGLLEFPVGSAIIKSFGYKIDGKDRLLETRVLLHRADGWLALPYVWNAEQTEATLKVAGTRIPITFTDPSGNERSISYAVPNKNQCKECHALSGEVVPIGPKLRNLSHDSVDMFRSDAVLELKSGEHSPMPDYTDNAMSIDGRARAYLDINCAHCHNRKGSASNSGLFLTYEEENPVHVGIGKRPTAAGRGSGGLDFAIAPGSPDKSIMIYRMKSTDPGIAMPEVGRSLAHDEGVALLSEWIGGLQ